MKVKEVWNNETGELPDSLYLAIVRYLESHTDKIAILTLELQKKTRSLLQNKYYWAVVLKYIAEDIGYDTETVHDYMKKMFLGYQSYDFPDGTTHQQLRSTTSLDTAEMEEYLKNIRSWAKDFLSIFIPLPNETEFNYEEYE